MTQESLPNRTSYLVLLGTFLLAINMYVDRAAVGQLKGSISSDFGWKGDEAAYFMGAFFWAYAVGQLPAAALGLRFGLKTILTICLIAWSIATIVTGLSQTLGVLIASRIALGLAEAGAYPNANALIRGWYPIHLRGRACSAVTFGGRLGWAVSQFLTPILEVGLGSWRSVLVVYGALGVVLAVPFQFLAKEKRSNTLTAPDSMPGDTSAFDASISIWQLLQDVRILCSSVVQFMINFGWVFLLTDLPTYLESELGVPKIRTGLLSSIPAFVSCVGMVLGGWITDWMAKRFGLRWARALPIAITMFMCSATYIACPWIRSPLPFVLVISIIAIAVDISNPSIWAFSQDVGGRGAGKVLAWGNMFGNFGAGLSPIALSWIRNRFGWEACFWTFAVCFSIAGCFALGMRGRTPAGSDGDAQNVGAP